MFKNLQRELSRIGKMTEVSVPLEYDAEGYLDRECPSDVCLFSFKVYGADWKAVVRDEEVFCPSCRHVAHAQSWHTTAQAEAAKAYALGTITNGMNKAMRADASESKRNVRRSTFSITLDVKGGKEKRLVPIAASDPMQLRTSCEACNCRYSYVGAAYFCPSCGKNSATHTFSQTMSTIRTAAGIGETLRSVLGRDEAENMTRALLEKAMQDAVMSFQRLCEQLYEQRSGRVAQRNAFQRLDSGSQLWATEIGTTYDQMIDSASLQKLRTYFQQRHLLSHQQGIVDQDYITRSGDHTYTIGQRLVVREPGVQDFANLVENLGNALITRM
jgi:uncharacterized Zn finger protein (UPF0148 family)